MTSAGRGQPAGASQFEDACKDKEEDPDSRGSRTGAAVAVHHRPTQTPAKQAIRSSFAPSNIAKAGPCRGGDTANPGRDVEVVLRRR